MMLLATPDEDSVATQRNHASAQETKRAWLAIEKKADEFSSQTLKTAFSW
jgi:hypothetical protein